MSETAKPLSIVKQVLILLASGLVLSTGSCAGFLTTFNANGSMAVVFAIGFVVGVLLIIGTALWALVRVLKGNKGN